MNAQELRAELAANEAAQNEMRQALAQMEERAKALRTDIRKAETAKPKTDAQRLAESREILGNVRAEFKAIAEKNGGRTGARKGAPFMSKIITSGLTKGRMGYVLPTNSDVRYYFDNEADAQATTEAIKAHMKGVDFPKGIDAVGFFQEF